MKHSSAKGVQRGAVLVVGLLMMVILTVLIASTFMISMTNLKSVGNMQVRDEAIAATSAAIATALTLKTMPTGTQLGVSGSLITVPIDINGTQVADYFVDVTRTCMRAERLIGGGDPSSVTLPFEGALEFSYLVLWEYDATVTDSVTGANVRVRQGVRELLTQPQCDSQCPPAAGTSCFSGS